ncbi:MAG: tannase/feruloyl esterase family alpha/beta hydrolase [Novosphingobium sp.]|nr:tannase/feruloyl esterase family alpha/beta hydrolase [Novosphingobium sp.]
MTVPAPVPLAASELVELCNAESMASIASNLVSTQVAIGTIANFSGPKLPGGVSFTPAKGDMPAFCQVTGSFKTNRTTGKTANFLATLPENWNGKYLQMGCGGHCGTFAVSNAASPTITITNQGTPGQIIRKGYASFATDEGHVSMDGGTWAVKGPGKVHHDAIDDLLYKSHQVLAPMGKEFARAFYTRMEGANRRIDRAYFSGCSGGGRDALVAASYMPEQFDGIIAGSPYKLTVAFQAVGTSLATLRAPNARISDGLMKIVSERVNAQCDALDGVRDGLIQNPAACDFAPERDLPNCAGEKPGDQCFTGGQIETLSTVLTAVTDEAGNIVQPAYSVSILQTGFQPPAPPKDRSAIEPWPDNQHEGGLFGLANSTIKIFAHGNDPDFATRRIISFRDGGPGPTEAFRIVVPRNEVDMLVTKLRMGIGHFPENADAFIRQGGKLLIWHNFSDQLLTPYMSVNYYKQLAGRHGGYTKLRDNVRLFALPGTAHCSGGGAQMGPGSFDALGAMEDWVEKGIAPNALRATLYEPTSYGVDFAKPLGRTMPLCAFPQMAKYDGSGDVNDAANWRCPAGDTRMLRIGESGRRAGVIE